MDGKANRLGVSREAGGSALVRVPAARKTSSSPDPDPRFDFPHLHDVTIAPITTTIRGIASEVRLSVGDGMPEECAANFHHLQTVPKRKLGQLITTLSAEKMREVGPALCFALGVEISTLI